MTSPRNALAGCTCSTCPHWHHPGEKDRGLCVAHPPQPIVIGLAPASHITHQKAGMRPVVQSQYPQTGASDGCHEHPEYATQRREKLQ